MASLAREQRVVLVANRFRWKDGADDDGLPSAPAPQRAGEDAAFAEEGAPPPFERVNSGLCFDKVRQVRSRGLRPGAKDQILCLLTPNSRPDALTLLFPADPTPPPEAAATPHHPAELH